MDIGYKHENYVRVLNLRKSQCYLSESGNC